MSDLPSATTSRGSLFHLLISLWRWWIAYLVSGFVVVFFQPGTGVALWYPPIAIGMAVFFRHGWRCWPMVFLCDYAITWFGCGKGWDGTAIISANLVIEANLGAFFIRQVLNDGELSSVSRFAILMLLAGIVATFFGSASGALILQAVQGGDWWSRIEDWRNWWIGDAASVTCLLPLLLLGSVPREPGTVRAPGTQREFTVLLAFIFSIAVTAFFLNRQIAGSTQLLPWIICNLAIIWAAIRFGYREMAIAVALIDTLLVAITWWAQVHGPSVHLIPLLELQILMAVDSIAGVCLALAIHSERRMRYSAQLESFASARNEQRLQHLLDSMVEGCQILDRDFKYVYLNPTAVRFVKRPREQLIGTPIIQICPDIKSTPLYSAVMSCLETGEPARIEHTCIYSKDTRSIYQSSIQAVAEGVMILSHDITQAKLHQQEALRNAELLRAVVEGSSDLICVKDLQGRYLLANSSTLRYMQQSLNEVVGKTDYELLDRESAQRIRAIDAEIIQANKPMLREYDVSLQNGCTVTLLTMKTPLLDANQQVTGVISIAHDVTQLRAAEKAVSASDSRYRAVFDYSEDSLFVIQADGLIADANQRACELVGLSRNQVCGQPAEKFRLPRTRDFQSVAGSIFPNALVQDITLPNGQTTSMEFRGRLFQSDNDWLELLSGRDISFQRRAEAVENQHRSQIAHLSRVASVGEFASSLAHEVNQPLSAILNYATVLQDLHSSPAVDRSGTQTREFLGEVVKQAVRAGDIVRSIRRFIQKENGYVRHVSINDAVRNAMNLLKSELRDEGVRLQLHLEEDLPDALVDLVQIEQVLINLTYNSIDAMRQVPVAERSLDITTRWTSGNHVDVIVTDTGPGVAKEVEPRLFESFFTTKPKGLGLGLSICRSIIESHGGSLNVTSNTSAGLAVCFSLPLERRQ